MKGGYKMNWSDYVVLGIIGAFALAGLFKGFIMSAYRLVSYVVSIFLSIRLAPVLAGILEKSAVYGTVKGMIVSNLKAWRLAVFKSGNLPDEGVKGMEQVLGPMPMPDIFKSLMLRNLPSPSETTDTAGLMDTVGNELTGIIISILSLVIIYIVLRLVLALVGTLLRGISALPVFRQVNKLGGLLLGTLRGVLAVYVLFAVLMMFNSNLVLAPVFEAIESSRIASAFYGGNFIINFLFPPVTA